MPSLLVVINQWMILPDGRICRRERTVMILEHEPEKTLRVYLVEEQLNPSSDFFVLPVVRHMHVQRCGFCDLPSAESLVDAVVVFVRYVPSSWMRLIESIRPSLRALIFFMDDDVLDISASTGLPLRYRFKLARLSAMRVGWLRRMRAQLWVSTPCLHQKYAKWSPKLVLPEQLKLPEGIRRVFYHGSASHAAEARWLRPVIEEVLGSDERVVFEIIGGNQVYRMFRGVPRVQVVCPMKWPAYQAFIAMPGRHVGLAPLMDTTFNRARSYTRFFDITRAGAVGIYAKDSIYSSVVEHGVDGLIVPSNHTAWAAAILSLARDDVQRERMLHAAKLKSWHLGERAESTRAKDGRRSFWGN